jgi:hypothetical protein
MSKQIFSKIAKIGEEVRAQEPMKVELALVDDLRESSNFLEAYVADLKAMKKSIQMDMRRIKSIEADGADAYKATYKMWLNLEEVSKQLGVSANTIPQYAAAQKNLQGWLDATKLPIE